MKTFQKIMLGIFAVLAVMLAIGGAPIESYVVVAILLAAVYLIIDVPIRARKKARERAELDRDVDGIVRRVRPEAGSTAGAHSPALNATQRIGGAAQSAAVAVNGGMDKNGQWVPPKPAGTVVQAWIPSWGSVEVVGEAYRAPAFASIFRNVRDFRTDYGAQLDDIALLGDDRDNPYGHGRAVSVWVKDKHVGYLANDDTEAWHPVISAMKDKGYVLGVPARVWAVQRNGDPVRARVTLTMGDPSLTFPVNEIPERAAMLPPGNRFQVTKEDDHLDVLQQWVGGPPAGTAVVATLHAITEIRPRSAPELVEVRIDGERVGVLSGVTSNNLLPLVKYIEARGWEPTVRALVKGSSLKADVEITAIKAQEADEAWLKALGEPVPVTVYNTRPDDEWGDSDDRDREGR